MARANIEAGERDIQLGDESFVVKFDAGLHVQLEDMLNMESGEIQEKLNVGSVRVLRAVLFIGTRKKHKKDLPNPGDITPLLDGIEKISDVTNPLMEAYVAGYPGMTVEEEEEEEEEDIAPTRKTRKGRQRNLEPVKEDEEVKENV